MSRRRKSTTPLLDGLAEYREAVLTAKRQQRETMLEHRAAQAEVERLRDARIDALSKADEQTAQRLNTERHEAERTSSDLADRATAAARAVQHREAEQRAYASEHLPGLLLERSPDARDAADAVEQAVADLARAKARWDAVQADAVSLLRTAGASTAGLPSFPNRLADLVRDARRADGGGCPPPMHVPAAPVSQAA